MIYNNKFRITEKLKSKLLSKSNLLKAGGLLSAVIFMLIVSFVLYRSISTALFESEQTSASSLVKIQDEKLKEALELAKKWQEEKLNKESSQKPDYSQYKIAVYNGTVTEGLEQEVASKLRSEGFTQISEVKKAERQDYEKTIIRVKADINNIIGALQKALSLTDGSFLVEELPNDAEFDIVIILGD